MLTQTVRPDGYKYPAQPYAMRAPEVYSSQVWALAATLFCWIKPGTFGTGGNTVALYREGWSIAKLMRLFSPWAGPPSSNPIRQAEFNLGAALINKQREPEILKISSLEDEMQSICMPLVLKSLLRRLLVVDPGQRPSAAQVLASSEYLALEEKALAMVKL